MAASWQSGVRSVVGSVMQARAVPGTIIAVAVRIVFGAGLGTTGLSPAPVGPPRARLPRTYV